MRERGAQGHPWARMLSPSPLNPSHLTQVAAGAEGDPGTRKTMSIYVGAGATCRNASSVPPTSQGSTRVFHVGREQTTWTLQAKQMKQKEHVAELWDNFSYSRGLNFVSLSWDTKY